MFRYCFFDSEPEYDLFYIRNQQELEWHERNMQKVLRIVPQITRVEYLPPLHGKYSWSRPKNRKRFYAIIILCMLCIMWIYLSLWICIILPNIIILSFIYCRR
jgi:hypothetical protein